MSLLDAGSPPGHVPAATPIAGVARGREPGARYPGATVCDPPVAPFPAAAFRALVPCASTGPSR